MTSPKLLEKICEAIEKSGSVGYKLVLRNLYYKIPEEYISLTGKQLREQLSNELLRDSAKRNSKLLDRYYPTKTQIAGRMAGEIGKDIAEVGIKIGKKSLETLSIISKGTLFIATAPLFGSLTELLRKNIYDKMAEPMPWYDYQTYKNETNTFSFLSSLLVSPLVYTFVASRFTDIPNYQVGLVLLGGVIESSLRARFGDCRKPGSLVGTLASRGIIYLRKKYSYVR